MNEKPAWNDDRGMHSFERWKVNWLNYIDVTSNSTVTLTDYFSTNCAYRIPLDTDDYYLIENRQKISSHDYAGDKGVYIYYVRGNYFPPLIEIKTAEGNWDYFVDTINQKIIEINENKNGKNEMNFNEVHGGVTYGFWEPFDLTYQVYGDNEDAFDLGYNTVINPVSNPPSTNQLNQDFTIEIVGKNGNNYNVKIFLNDIYSGAPSRPQNLRVTRPGHLKLWWDHNQEPDINYYEIQCYVPFLWWASLGTTTNNYWDHWNMLPAEYHEVRYKVRARDTQGKWSVYSHELITKGDLHYFEQNKNHAEINIPLNTELFQNYPNPFNPTTLIPYSLKNNEAVSIKIYNTLGQEVAIILNNEMKNEGKHIASFDGTDLASGIYIYKLTAGNYTETKKMILMK